MPIPFRFKIFNRLHKISIFLFLFYYRRIITQVDLPFILLCLHNPHSFHLRKEIIKAVGLRLHSGSLALYITKPLRLEVLL